MAEDIGQGFPVTELYAADGHVSVAPESVDANEAVDADEAVLNGLGYRQEFKRKFNMWSIFSLSFSSLGLLPSMAATLTFSLGLVCFNAVLIVGMLEAEGLYGGGLLQLS